MFVRINHTTLEQPGRIGAGRPCVVRLKSVQAAGFELCLNARVKPQVLGFSDKDFFPPTYLIHDLCGEEICCDSSGEALFDCCSYA
jgi:hypothetical protein